MCRTFLLLFAVVTMTCVPAFAQPAAVALPEGINDKFLDPKMNPEEWAKRFERDGREAYEARNEILAALDLQPGMRVADVGAGSGLFTVLFSSAVGDEGWVFAVDISSNFVQHIANRAQAAGINNITPVLCDEDSVNLPAESIDLAYVCDTYHHFEHPEKTVASIYKALRPGGRLVVVDFVREEGVSSEWTLGHVRAGKDVFTQEILSTGFELADEPKLKGLKENYLLVFRKPEA
ncbi:methyltransferase domain-containing protein [Aeoliella sp. ICT_H6.2]|uniref:Methyltransferase domain-containing protein n=1 Tax=Aeoliella straminimaris TaxID=2954799 RepID=A0A9X2F7Z9_9BACT|nr:methyltransferase domain-containing protein [Aeoliella straminimaris]MCO6044030.1 methyltransferase domain-containing protein [Aeoliella straminimaris]